MEADQLNISVIRFGAFELSVSNRELRRKGLKVDLQPQARPLLVLLASHPNELLTREQIRGVLWPEEGRTDADVLDRRLNFEMNKLREALGDDADSPRHIETVRKSGYRFVASTQTAEWPNSGPLIRNGAAEGRPVVEPSAHIHNETNGENRPALIGRRNTWLDFRPLLLGAVLGAAAMAGGIVVWRAITRGLMVRPVITAVSPITAMQNQRIVIEGRGLGYYYTPLNGLDTPFLAIGDRTGHWAAGRTMPENADDVTLIVTTWTDTQITIAGFSGDYGKNDWMLKPGDTVRVWVWNPQTGAGPAEYYLKVGPSTDLSLPGKP